MNEEAAFLRAICESPDDDTPRLVFADWLTEQGGAVNTAWANGIRAQIWQVRGDPSAALAQQSRIFETSYGQGKLHERLGLPHWLVNQWERGFPTCAAANYGEMREAWHRLAFRVPICKLNIYEARETNVAEFVAWPALSGLRELTISISWEVPPPIDMLPLLAGCADLSGLEVLKVTGASIDVSSVTAILDSEHLAGLKLCNLGYGYDPNWLSPALRDRFRARFGPDSIIEEDPIPF